MATRQSGAQRTLDVAVAVVAGAIVAAFLFPIGVDFWTTYFEAEGMSSGAESLVGMGDVVMVVALFLFLTMLAIKAARR